MNAQKEMHILPVKVSILCTDFMYLFTFTNLLFIHSLFNVAVGSSDYITLNDWLVDE
jgi:hypothetical protein